MNLIAEGDKVGASEATLLNMLNISPFSYGLLLEKGKFPSTAELKWLGHFWSHEKKFELMSNNHSARSGSQ